jgi:hypothetical protein
MNHFSYEILAKEKISGFQEEGLRNQEIYRSVVPKRALLRNLPKLILASSTILSILVWMSR